MIIIRADGNSKIGAGHIMRCLSIADGFRRAGEESLFVMADNALQAQVEHRGYRVSVLNSDYDDMEGEQEKLKAILTQCSPKLLIVDSYYVTLDYLQTLRQFVTVAYLDDVLAFAYPVDILINYNIFSNRAAYETLYADSSAETPILLLGTAYTPLRTEFQNIPLRHKDHVGDILISTGGADTEHVALRLADRLMNDSPPFDTITFHMVVGAVNQDADIIIQKCANIENVIIHQNVSDIKSLMVSCDIAVSAAGSTLYELCACGVPIITYVVADNQVPAEREFVSKGMVMSVGDIRDNENFVENIMETTAELIHNNEKRNHLAEQAHSLIDGGGADALAAKLLAMMEENRK